MSTIKIGIVDDHRLFREGLGALISQNEDFEVIVSVDTGQEILQALSDKLIPHVLLLDLSMPEIDGFEVLTTLKKKYPEVRAIAISMHDDGNYIVKCTRLGAYGYLLKNVDEDELFQAIYTVYGGKKYFNKQISELMIDTMSLEGNIPRKLSAKETEILKLISEGHTTKEIAEMLYISTRTVETHRTNMMKKLEVKNSAELVKKATSLHLL